MRLYKVEDDGYEQLSKPTLSDIQAWLADQEPPMAAIQVMRMPKTTMRDLTKEEGEGIVKALEMTKRVIPSVNSLQKDLDHYGLVAVPLEPTKLRIASIGMTIQGTMDRMELTYDDISEAVYRVAVEPEVVIAAQGESYE